MRKRLTPSLVVVVLALAFAAPGFGSTDSGARGGVIEQQVINVRETTVSSRVFTRRTATCASQVHKTTGEGAGFIDLFWVKQSLVWCWQNVHGVRQIVKEPYLTPKCGGRDWGITSAGIGWTWEGWAGCKPSGGAGYTYVKRWSEVTSGCGAASRRRSRTLG
jgi:hypothetical protein